MPAQRVRLFVSLIVAVALTASAMLATGGSRTPTGPDTGMRFGDYLSAPTPHADEELDPQAAQVYQGVADLWSVPGVGVPTLAQHVAPSCTGDGTDGKRIQVAYVRGVSQPDTYAAAAGRIRERLREVDDIFAVSAAKTGGGLRVRWVTDTSCVPVVENIVLSDLAMRDWSAYYAELKSYGWNNPDRKYLGFTTGKAYCGLAELPGDDRAMGSMNEKGPHIARVDAPCWDHATTITTPAHELAHMLGAVNGSTPNNTGFGHCTDESDVMCYDDDAPGETRAVCPAQEEYLLDCNNDDYLHMNPPAGSYLARHWNLARSPFLDVVPALPEPPHVVVTASEAAGQRVSVSVRSTSGDALELTSPPPGCNIFEPAPGGNNTDRKGRTGKPGKAAQSSKTAGRKGRAGQPPVVTTGTGALTAVYDCNLVPGTTRTFSARSVSAATGRVAVGATAVQLVRAPGRVVTSDKRVSGTRWNAHVDLGGGWVRRAYWKVTGPCRIVGNREVREVLVECRPARRKKVATLQARVDFPWRSSVRITKTVRLLPARR